MGMGVKVELRSRNMLLKNYITDPVARYCHDVRFQDDDTLPNVLNNMQGETTLTSAPRCQTTFV